MRATGKMRSGDWEGDPVATYSGDLVGGKFWALSLDDEGASTPASPPSPSTNRWQDSSDRISLPRSSWEIKRLEKRKVRIALELLPSSPEVCLPVIRTPSSPSLFLLRRSLDLRIPAIQPSIFSLQNFNPAEWTHVYRKKRIADHRRSKIAQRVAAVTRQSRRRWPPVTTDPISEDRCASRSSGIQNSGPVGQEARFHWRKPKMCQGCTRAIRALWSHRIGFDLWDFSFPGSIIECRHRLLLPLVANSLGFPPWQGEMTASITNHLEALGSEGTTSKDSNRSRGLGVNSKKPPH
jgi:hypothetical protein